MPINAQYYGAESTWLDFPPVAGMTDPFKTGQYSTIEDSAYGLSTRTWVGCKYGYDINTYYEPLDKSFCWCKTDGNAPFDKTFAVTGFRSGTTFHYAREMVNNISANSIGLCIHGNATPYLLNDKVRYYKTSSTGSTTLSDTPLNFKPSYDFAPRVATHSNGLKVLYCANASYSPALKFDFGNYYIVPFIKYYVLTSTATKTDWNNVTNVSDYSTLVQTTKTDDLRTFVERINNNTYDFNKIIISGIYAIVNHVTWNNDDTYTYDNVSRGTKSNTTGVISLFRIHDKPYKITFSDWYNDTDDADEYTVDIDMSFVDNACVSIGSCGIYNGKTNSISAATLTNETAILLSGTRTATSTGYTQPTTYCYMLQPIYSDSEKCSFHSFDMNFRDLPAFLNTDSFSNVNELREYVRKSCAYFGMFFSESYYPNATREWISTDCFIGTIDENGITHGAYTQGADNANQPQRTWGDEWATKTPYDPGKPPKPDQDPNNYINGMPGTNQLSIASFTRLYAMTPNDLTYLRAYLKYIPTQYTDFDAYRDFLGQKFLNSNPIDNMVSLRWYPFDVVDNVMVFVPITQPIQISNATAQWTESGSTYTVQGTTSLYPVYYFTLYLGSVTPQTAYGNFLDYEPYSDAKMYLPFCGTASIDLKSILDVTLYVSYKVDVRTGACTAIVAADDYDGNIILTAHGSLAVEIPITGVQSADYQNAVFQAINNLKNAQIAQFTAYVQSATGLIGAAATTAANPLAGVGAAGNAVTGIAGAMQAENNLKQAQYDLKTAQIKHTVVGSTSAGDGSMMYLYPALIVNRPTFIYGYNPDVYAHTVGNACILSDTLGAFTGFTVVSAIDLDNVQATETEKNMIRSILAAGIYL